MPRKTKTQNLPATSPGQPYGVAGEQVAAMNTIPLPTGDTNNFMDQPVTPDQVTDSLAPVGSSMNEGSNFANILQEAVSSPTPGPGAFSAPTERPSETLDSALMQPAPKPMESNPTVQTLMTMARNMGNDPALMEIANMMQARGY